MPTLRRTSERSERVWHAFRARVAELGGTVLEPVWLGRFTPHRVRCAAGHESTPRPGNVQSGQGLCRVCVGQDSATAWSAFRARVVELGGTVLEPVWLGNGTPHRVMCVAAHECRPRPADVQRGQGICRVCAGNDPVTTERAFHARVVELGGTVLEPVWLGAVKPHRVRCAAGHECNPAPYSLQQGSGMCRVCAGNDPVTTERAFHARVVELGGTVLEPVWLGAVKPHRVRCAAGHECMPYPTAVQQGGGICRVCAGKAWDVFYVVADDAEGRVKFGITSGDPRPRLGDHARHGYGRVVRLLADLPADAAPALERSTMAALRLAGLEPVRGREYFDASALAVVLDIVDNYPMPTGTARVPALPIATYGGKTMDRNTDPRKMLDHLDPIVSPDLDAYAAGQLDASEVRCALCQLAPCDCPPFGTAAYFELIDQRHGKRS